MGQDYSTEQKAEFQTFRKMIDMAVKDSEPYNDFKNSLNKVKSAIQNNHPLD